MNIDMRDAFFDELYSIACKDKQVMLLTADMGARSIDKFRKDFPTQFINMGISEQNMISVAVGLALSGKKVFVYSIIPFVTYRCYEQIKIDICGMNLPVTIIGIGAGFSYAGEGPTHYGTQDIALMRTLPQIKILNSSDGISAKKFAEISYKSNGPIYVRIDKEKVDSIHSEDEDFSRGFSIFREGKDILLITTGIMLEKILEIADRIQQYSIRATIIDLYQIKPINKQLLEIIGKSRETIVIEENNLSGGIGSAISEALNDENRNVRIKRFAIADVDCLETGSRENLHQFFGIDIDTIVDKIMSWN